MKDLISYPLSNDDIQKILRNVKIITYPELANYKTIEDLLPQEFTCVVILILEKPHEGHWTGLMRYSNMFEHFDSYGNPPDYDITHWLDESKRAQLNESTLYLTNLLKGRKHIYNKIKYQSKNPNVADCGSHTCYRLYKFKNDGMTLSEYQKHMKNLCKLYGSTPDEIVTEFISHFIN